MNNVDVIYLSRRDLLVLLNKLDSQFNSKSKEQDHIIKTRTDSSAFVPSISLLKVVPVENNEYYSPPKVCKDLASY